MIYVLVKRTVLFVNIFLITFFTAYCQWQLGNYAGRTWEKIEVPNTLCGDSITPYSFFFSPAISNSAQYRLTVYFPGGGSTQLASDGSMGTNLKNLQLMRGLLSIPAVAPGSNKLIFMDRPENNVFVGEGHWVIFPYCTQDMYLGRRDDVQVYDFTYADEQSNIKAEIEFLINVLDWTIDSVEQKFPPVKIKSYSFRQGNPIINPLDDIVIDSLEIPVLHRGALNIEAAFSQAMDSITARVPDFVDFADVIVSGGSAGAFGALHHFYRFGDLLYAQAGTRITLIPMGGFPATKVWNVSAGDLVIQPSRSVEIDHRFNFYKAVRPCETAGGSYTPQPEPNCDDILDIISHYRDDRYPGKDILFAPMVNKQDFVVVNNAFREYGHDYDSLDQALMTICQTIHAYGYYFSEIENVYPYLLWTYIKGTSHFYDYYGIPIKPEHVPQEASLLKHIQQPNGVEAANDYNILEFVNRIAARQLETIKTSNIEFMPNVLLNYSDTGSGLIPYPECFNGNYGDCNVIPQLFSGMQKIQEKSSHFSLDHLYTEEDNLSIVFSTGKEIPLNLAVFDVAGRMQKETAKSIYTKGTYTVRLNISSLPSGFYFCRLTDSQKAYSEKFIVVR